MRTIGPFLGNPSWPSLHGIGTWLCFHRIPWFSLGRDFPCPLVNLIDISYIRQQKDNLNVNNWCYFITELLPVIAINTHTQTDRWITILPVLFRKKRDHLCNHGSPVQTITYDFSHTNVQINSIDYVSVYSKKARILINLSCYNLRMPPAPSGDWVNDIHELSIMCCPQPDDHYVQSGGAVKCLTNVKNERLRKHLRGQSETCELMRQQNLCLALMILLSKDPHNSPDAVQVKLLQDPSQTAPFRR